MDQGHSPSKSGEVTSKGNRHLELAVTHCSESWFPINPQVLQNIQHGIKGGKYEGGRDALIADLKTDFALLTHTIRKLISRHGAKLETQVSPIALLEKAELKDLIEVLDVSEGEISNHRMIENNPAQNLRLKQAMIAATTAELLCDQGDVDPELGFSCGLLRQLGLTLIAWNYPHVYKRVISTLKPNEKLDSALTKILGFSPNLLGISLAREWGLAPEVRATLGDPAARESLSANREALTLADNLDRICKVGEALARASDPEHYPTAKQDWSDAKTQIEQALGPEGLKLIREKLEQTCKAYSKSSPDIFSFNQTFAPVPKVSTPTALVANAKSRDLFKHNQYIKHCAPELQEQLKKLYLKIDGLTLSKENIDTLCKEIIPESGFQRGCIFLIEPDTQSLMPRLLLGSAYPGYFKTVNYQQASSEFDPIVAAFRCQYPVMEQKVRINDIEVSYVAGVLGDAQKAGVIYLEIGESLLNDLSANILGTFKALRQALTDCLALG